MHRDKKLSRNTVYGVPFLDQKPSKLISSTDFENSIVDVDMSGTVNARAPS